MMNFTGQSRKRVVNLGNSRGGRKGSFLETTKAQRIEREQQRLKEKASKVIQFYVKRYLELSYERQQILEIWLNSFDISPQWVSQIRFVAKWSNAKAEDIQIWISHIHECINKAQDGFFDEYPVIIRQSLSTTMEILCNKMAKRQYSSKFWQVSCEIFHKLYDKNIKYHSIISTIIQVLKGGFLNAEAVHSIEDLAFKINAQDSLVSFFQFLFTVNLDDFSREFQYKVLFNFLIEIDSSFLKSFVTDELIKLLAAFIKLHNQFDNAYSLDYMNCIGKLLDEISVSIEPIDILQESQGHEIDGTENQINTNIQYVSSGIFSAIKQLYQRDFILSVFENLDSDESYILTIISTLPYLIPSLKNTFYMFATIGKVYSKIYAQIVKNEIFQNFLDIEVSNDFTTQISLHFENSSFWKLVYSFESLYAYWMIVSNDLETFSKNALTIDQIVIFLKFLKTLCLTLIFNNIPKYSKLKETSIMVLNQLYLKNLRLKFVDDKFWQLKTINFDTAAMSKLIIDNENKRNEIDDNSDYENIMDLELQKSNTTSTVLSQMVILEKLPFFINFKSRVLLFQELINNDKKTLQSNEPWSLFTSNATKLSADIRREYVLDDAFAQLHNSGYNLKNPLKVRFFNNYGEEAGIDGGGITKEFLTSVIKEGFDPQNEYHLFKETSQHQLYPNEDIFYKLSKKIGDEFEHKKILMYYKFLGNIIGKCFYENVLIDISFAPFFLSKWCNANRGYKNLKNSINDLKSLDEELFTNLMKLNSMTNEQLQSLHLSFTIEEVVDNKTYSFDLMPNGSQLKLNETNKLNYIHQISNFKINEALHVQTKYFMEGLFEIIPSRWLSFFDSLELQMLISGGENDVNIVDWKQHCVYGGYFDDDITIQFFWEVVEEMTPDERFKLIKFVTSVSRAPLLGFGSLSPSFAINCSGNDPDRLPTASTCVNLLKLPDYKDKAMLREKLLYAINTDAGFDLS